MAPDQLLTFGLALAAAFSSLLLAATLSGWTPIPLVVLVMVGVALSFGFISPNAMGGALRPLPRIAGSVSALAGLFQTAVSAGASALVAVLFDGHTALSMAGTMLFFSLLAVVVYVRMVARAMKALA